MIPRVSNDNLNKEGRAGLVATNSIREIKSRAAALDYIVQNEGFIHEAISTQPWSGEANVHVSIVNWSKKVSEVFYLDNLKVQRINSSLRAEADFSKAQRLKSNYEMCFEGAKPTGTGFIVTQKEVEAWIDKDKKNAEVLKLFSMGSNLEKNPHGLPDRWIIDFNERGIEEASEYYFPFEHVELNVKPQRDKNRRESRRIRWWRYGENAPKMRKAIANLEHLFVVPRVSKWATFIVTERGWLLGEKSVVGHLD